MKQILYNLIQNAIQASPPGGRICVAVGAAHDELIVTVKDEGPGIAPETLPRIFDPFFTTKQGGSEGGMGLGLSVSRSLAEASGGRIDVESRPGCGSTFSMAFPCGRETTFKEPCMNAASPARILIADDEPLFLKTTGDLLQQSGYECRCVADAPQALAALDDQAFDLLIADLKMPGNLKLELLEQGRSRFPHVPLIVVTGAPSLPSAIESVRLGIADYLLKPVKFDDLLASVNRALSAREPSQPAGDAPFSQNEAAPEIVGDSPALCAGARIRGAGQPERRPRADHRRKRRRQGGGGANHSRPQPPRQARLLPD